MQSYRPTLRHNRARTELLVRAEGLFPNPRTTVPVCPDAFWRRAILCWRDGSGLGVKQRLCDERGWRSGFDTNEACFPASDSGRISLHSLRWRLAEQPKATKRHRLALRSVGRRRSRRSNFSYPSAHRSLHVGGAPPVIGKVEVTAYRRRLRAVPARYDLFRSQAPTKSDFRITRGGGRGGSACGGSSRNSLGGCGAAFFPR